MRGSRPGPGRRVRPLLGAAVAALGLVTATAGPAAAQADEEGSPLNGSGFVAAEEDTGWRGSADLGFTLTRGNSQTTTVSVAGLGVWRGEHSRWTLDASLLRATDGGEETANKGDGAVRYDRFPSERFFVFGRAAASYNRPAGLDLRIAPSAGAGYQLVQSDRHELTVRGGGSWIRDEFTDGTSDQALHALLAQAYHWELSETADFEQSLTYEPKAEALRDYLLTARASLAATITGGLGLKLSVTDEFDSEPFDPGTGETIEENDLTLVTGLTYQF